MKTYFTKSRILLVLIITLGLFLRVYRLAYFPPGFTPDEAAFGYNAYSILQTGKDEWGTDWYRLPFTNLRSFGDYKMPLYVFLALPSVKFFGLTEFATRLPNAITGTLAILAIYLLANKLFSRYVGILASFVLAISPWAIGLSRGAFEANLITFLLPFGIYLFISRSYFLSALFFALNLYSYHSARLLTPLILALLIVPHFKKSLKAVFPFILVFAILSLPAALSYFGSGANRVSDVSIFSPTDNWRVVSDARFTADNAGLPDSLSRLFSNKLIYLSRTFVQNYFGYLSPQFLFTSGAGEGTYGLVPGTGLAYLIELPLVVVFLIRFIQQPSRRLLFVLVLILLAPLPASLAKGPGYAANRAAPMMPFVLLGIAIGLSLVKKKFVGLVLIIYLASFAFFAEDYFYQSPTKIGQAMLYGRSQAFTRFIDIANRFPRVAISSGLSEPHIYLAFYQKIPPTTYQAASRAWLSFEDKKLKFLDQLDGYYLGKYRFGTIHPQDPVAVPTLYMGKSDEFPPDFPEYFHVDYPNGKPAITVAEKLP